MFSSARSSRVQRCIDQWQERGRWKVETPALVHFMSLCVCPSSPTDTTRCRYLLRNHVRGGPVLDLVQSSKLYCPSTLPRTWAASKGKDGFSLFLRMKSFTYGKRSTTVSVALKYGIRRSLLHLAFTCSPTFSHHSLAAAPSHCEA